MSAYSGSFSGSFSGSYIGNGSQLTDIDYYSLSTIPRTITAFELNSVVANSHLRNTFTSSIKTTLNNETVVSSSVQISASAAAAGFGTAGAVLNGLWGNIAEKPAGLMSSSTQTVTNLIGTSISASSFSGSYYGDGSNLTGVGVPTGTVSSSAQTISNISGSYLVVANVTASGHISASGTLHSNGVNSSGDLFVGVGDNFSISSSAGYETIIHNGDESYNAFRLQAALTTYFRFDADSQAIGIGEIPDGTAIPKTLTVKGDISASGNLYATDITASGYLEAGYAGGNEPTYKFGEQFTTSGIHTTFNTGDEDVYFKVRSGGDANLLSVNPDANDRIGIGTATPTHKLTVQGDISASGNLYIADITASGYLEVGSVSGNAPKYTFGEQFTTFGTNTIFNTGDEDVYFKVRSGGDANLLSVNPDANDRIGIGTATPTHKLTVQGDISASGTMYATTVSASLFSGSYYGDGSNLTGISGGGSVPAGTVSSSAQTIAHLTQSIYTIDFMDAWTTVFYAPRNLQIDSINNIVDTPSTTILQTGSAYSFGNRITIGQAITVSVTGSSVIQLITTI